MILHCGWLLNDGKVLVSNLTILSLIPDTPVSLVLVAFIVVVVFSILYKRRASCREIQYIYIYIYIILIARVRVQYGKIFYEHAKYFHEPKASENVA